MNPITKLTAILTLGLSLVSPSFAAAPIRVIDYSISLAASPAFDAAANTTTFTYSVVSGTQPSISHWVLALGGSCGGAGSLVSSNDPLTVWSSPDPTTGMTGVKFDTGYTDGESRTVSFTLNGFWTTGTVDIAVKSGNGFVNGTVTGPVCGTPPPAATYTISGNVFFDANYNGTLNADEPGLAGTQITLVDASGATVATTVSDASGSYSFTGIIPGSYSVIVTHSVPALSPTTLVDHTITVSNANVTAPVTGFAINFTELNGLAANGFTIGYWKNNLSKAVAGATKGVQVSAATLSNYTSVVSTLALSPFAGLTMPSAVDTLSATGSAPTVLLAKQLLGSEYNYANQAYLGGSATLTYLFIFQGEYVLKNAANYSAAYILWLKDWFDAYNNTHGGAIAGPASF